MAVLKDRDSLKLWILRRLGAPIVKVELTEEQLLDAIEDAVRWFTAKKGVKKQAFLQMTVNQTMYPLPEDVDVVTDVAFPTDTWDLASAFAPWLLPEQQIPWDIFAPAGESMGIYSYWTQCLQYLEMGKRVLSAEADWRQEGRVLYFFAVEKLSGAAIIEYKTSSVTIEQLSERDHDLLKRYSLARAMEILGRIRSKYDSYPTAQGSVQLDGAALLSDSAAMVEELNEEISNSAYPMGILVG